jgi:hypothetical protein
LLQLLNFIQIGWMVLLLKNLLVGSTEIPFIKNMFSKEWFYLFNAYAGILFDLSTVPFLLFKKKNN